MDRVISNMLLASGFHGLLVFAVLYFSRKNRTSNRIFSFLILLTALSFFYLMDNFSESENIFFQIFGYIPGFLTGPLVYFYVKSLISTKKDLKLKDAVHLFPALLSLAGGSLIPAEIFIIAEDIQTFLYLYFSISLVVRFRANLPQYVSSLDSMRLKWLYLLLISLFLFRLYSIFDIVMVFWEIQIHPILDFLSLVAESFLIYVISYFVLSQREIFDDVFSRDRENNSEKYKAARLGENRAEMYFDRLLVLMETEKLYLQNAVTLKELAEEMDIPPHLLSQLINSRTGNNFYTFINEYRVKRACVLIKEADMSRTTMLDIAFESGFNSKTTFNEVFKKMTKKTPTEFRRINRP